MTLRYMLDTNVLAAIVKQPRSPLSARVAAQGHDAVAVSIIVACEVRYGLVRKGSPRLTQGVETLLQHLNVLPLTAPVDAHYADIRHGLEQRGLPIGHNDLLIAAHARALGLCLLTDNMREFARVPGLAVDNWLRCHPS